MEKSAEKTSSRQLGTHSKAFKSFGYWGFYETIGGNCFRVSTVIAVTSFWCIIKFNDFKVVFPSILVMICSAASLSLSFFFVMQRKELLAKRHISLMTAELQKFRPGVSEEAWNQVALELNDQFYQNGIWRSPYFFYDGNICQSLFRKILLVPFHKKEAPELSVTSEDLEKGPSVEENTDLDQETVNRLCAIEYEDSVRSYFNDTIAREPLEISPEFAVLPKELYSKFYFNIRFMISGQFFLDTVHKVFLFISASNAIPLWLLTTFLIALELFGAYSAYLTYCKRKFYKLSVPERIRILTEVMRTKPKSCDVETWEALAKGANQWLHAQGTWKKSDEFLYDGEEYKELYRNIQVGIFKTSYVELDSLAQEVKAALETA